MKSSDFSVLFGTSARANPKKINLPAKEISRRAALGESWAKMAKEYGTSPRIVAKRVQEYRYANLATDEVLEDIRLERAMGKDWLDLATRAGWPLGCLRNAGAAFAQEFNRLMNIKEASSVKKKRGGGRKKKPLNKASYEDFVSGKMSLAEIAEDNNMSIPTARKRLLEMGGPDIHDIRELVDRTPELGSSRVEEIAEEVLEEVNPDRDDPLAYCEIPAGYFDRGEILFFVREGFKVPEIAQSYGLTADDVEVLIALDQSPQALDQVVEAVSDTSTAIEESLAESVPEVVSEPPKPSVKAPKKTRRGRKKKTFDFSDEDRELIRKMYYDDNKYVFHITDVISERRGEKVTQTAVKEVISDYSQGRGRQSKIDKAALERDARRNLAVSTLAEMYGVSGPTIAKALRDMGIKPIYSLEKEARLRKPSEAERAERREMLARVQADIDAILNDDARRSLIKGEYLGSNLIGQNDVAVLAERHGLSTYNMALVLTEIFKDEIRRIRERENLDELVRIYGQDQLSKIQRDLIDRSTLTLRSNPRLGGTLGTRVIPSAQGVAAGAAVDQSLRYLYPDVSANKRNATSAAIVTSVFVADYLHEKQEEKLWRAAGGVAGVLISRLIESKFQK